MSRHKTYVVSDPFFWTAAIGGRRQKIIGQPRLDEACGPDEVIIMGEIPFFSSSPSGHS
jgi:hypothetical protein